MAGNAFKRDRQRVIFAVRQESGRSAFVGGSAEWIGAGGQAAEDWVCTGRRFYDGTT